ncbi:hypothetical protein MRP26_21740 [Bacillus sp. CCB-MMP212]|uniref:hypothetical protein n=1 Tax=Bacillus sp. CCB-MMP212 TaxID=2928002 RepID=UPI001F61619B|nr:hypothetical protein [Bacillus sp. CCB-MMP212]MCI4251546.1 hypothetical protein [Bacillus sp. CCB-MMP212]
MKRSDYFYSGISKRELKLEIARLLIKHKVQVTNFGIENMEIEDLKLLNAFIKSKAEQVKATQLYTSKLAFGLGILTLMMKGILDFNLIFGIFIVFIIFVSMSVCFNKDEKVFRKKVQGLYYLSNLLDLYIKERENNR